MFCYELATVTIRTNAIRFENDVFRFCKNLKTFVGIDENKLFMFGLNLFVNCTSLKSFAIPDSMVTVPDGAFQFCIQLSSINLPIGLLEIGKDAFFATKKRTLFIYISIMV